MRSRWLNSGTVIPEGFTPVHISPEKLNEMIFSKRVCSQCGSKEVVAVSVPGNDDGPLPCALNDLGESCLCKPCLLMRLGVTEGNA